MKFAYYFVSIAIVFQSAIAQQKEVISITQPVTGTTLRGGEKLYVEWIESEGKEVTPEKMQINLMNGNPNAAKLIAEVVKDLPYVSGKTNFDQWTIPKDIGPGDDYFLQVFLTEKGGKRIVVYSSTFGITDVTGKPGAKPGNSGTISGGSGGSGGSDSTRSSAPKTPIAIATVLITCFFATFF